MLSEEIKTETVVRSETLFLLQLLILNQYKSVFLHPLRILLQLAACKYEQSCITVVLSSIVQGVNYLGFHFLYSSNIISNIIACCGFSTYTVLCLGTPLFFLVTKVYGFCNIIIKKKSRSSFLQGSKGDAPLSSVLVRGTYFPLFFTELEMERFSKLQLVRGRQDKAQKKI